MMSKIVFVVLAMCIAQSFAEKCNPICTRELKPVCGMDNTGNQQTFSNLCLMEFESCSNRGAGWRVLADGECEQKTDSLACNGICTRIYNPVCGIDNTGNKRTFSNKCVFESEECNNRGAGWKILAENKCEAVQEVAVEDEVKCSPICTMEYMPVCGMDNTGNMRTFGNKCSFESAECMNRGAGWKLISEDSCQDVPTEIKYMSPKCKQFCTFEYKPVCAVDNTGNMQTFGNKCSFESEECNNRGAGWKLLANDACETAQVQDEAPRHGCNRMCTFEYSPVCAIDNTGNMQTFGNKCSFETEECMNRGAGWKLLADNACEAVQVRDETPKCNQMCTFIYSPVCAVDNTGNMRTFGNKCTFESEECMNRGAGWKLLAENACDTVQVQDETPKCNQFCTFEYSPVCAVDNTGNMRTFGNKCTFESEECMNRGAGWKLLANNECSAQLEVEGDEENCPKFCTLEYMPICGMDNFGNTRTFSNKCGFNMAQCFNRGAGWKVMSMDQC